jgi:hypothetical protein
MTGRKGIVVSLLIEDALRRNQNIYLLVPEVAAAFQMRGRP